MKIKTIILLASVLIVGMLFNVNDASAASKKTSLKLSSGATYYGEVKNGKPHGKGTARWGENKTYSGDWVNGKRSGNGKYTLMVDDGMNIKETIYIGQWLNDKQNGKGTLKEVSKFSNPEDDWRGWTMNVKKGNFKNGNFTYGYSILSNSGLGNFMSYEDSNISIQYHLYDINNIFKKNLISEDTNKFEVIKKTKKSITSVYKGIEEDMQSISVGTYAGDYEIYSGTEETLSGGIYSITKFSKGKVVTRTEKEVTDSMYEQFDKKMNKEITQHLSILKPHVKIFRDMIKEFKINTSFSE